MTSYLAFLQFLSQFTGKLPQILAAVKALSDWYTAYVVPLLPPAGGTNVFGAEAPLTVSEEELALEAELCSQHAEHHARGEFGAIGDGTILAAIRNAWAFLQANPQLLALLLSLFGKA